MLCAAILLCPPSRISHVILKRWRPQEWEKHAPTPMYDRACPACSECGDGTFKTSDCSDKSDTVCKPCKSTCPIGTWKSAVCSATADTTCKPCHQSCLGCSGRQSTSCQSCRPGYKFDSLQGTCEPSISCDAGQYAAACLKAPQYVSGLSIAAVDNMLNPQASGCTKDGQVRFAQSHCLRRWSP